MERNKDRSWVEINMINLVENVRQIQHCLPKETMFMAVVKADAYGHGAIEVSKALNESGVYAFAVATIEEGIALRKAGIVGEILILGYTHVERMGEVRKYDLLQTIIDYQYAKKIHTCGVRIQAHIKIDTGMQRLGNDYRNIEEIKEMFLFDNICVKGIFTHLSVSDSLVSEDQIFTKLQITHFYDVIASLKKENIKIPKVHIQSSYGVLNYPALKCDYARIGIAMYGNLSTKYDDTRISLPLKPVLSIKSQVALIKEVPKGASVGYGRDFVVSRGSKVAIIPIGYADGLPRNMKKQSVLIKGTKAPIIGRICMDQMLVDVTHIKDIGMDDVVTIIGKDKKEEIKVVDIANTANTITNEILSRVSYRLPKIYVKEKQYAP